MVKRMFQALVAITFLTLIATVNTSAQEVTASGKPELIRELLVVTETRKGASELIDSAIAEMDKLYPQLLERMVDADTSLTPAKRKKILASLSESHSRFSTAFRERLKQRIDLGQVVEEIGFSLYDKYFTEDEIKDLISFYKTPTGKKTLSVMPQMFAESIRQAGEKLTPVIINLAKELAAEEKEKMKR